MIIAIDGPSGAGKSTLGRMLARELNLLYIDTGAMYRAVALAVIEAGVSTPRHPGGRARRQSAEINLAGDPDSLQVTARWPRRLGQDSHRRGEPCGVRHLRRSRRCAAHSSTASASWATRGGVVLDGRDIGTVVFPEADIKFFLTAAPEERAARRYEEDRLRERDATFEETLADINTRDQRDSTRADSPLAIAEDAIVIDSTELSIEEVFERMMEIDREQNNRNI